MPETPDPSPPLNTFIVRFWHRPGAGGGQWRGQVQHIQSGAWTAFQDEKVLLAFLNRWVPSMASADDPPPAPKQTPPP